MSEYKQFFENMKGCHVKGHRDAVSGHAFSVEELYQAFEQRRQSEQLDIKVDGSTEFEPGIIRKVYDEPLTAKRSLFYIMDPEYEMWVIARNWQEAIDGWKAMVAAETDEPIEEIEEPEGIKLMAGPGGWMEV